MPRLGSRTLVLLGLVAIAALAAASQLARSEAPILDPVPEPPVALREPSRGRLLTEAEVRAQLPEDWRAARLVFVPYGELQDLPQPAGDIHPQRLCWLVVREAGARWELRAYDAASGIRLIDLHGEGSPPR